MSRQSLDLRSSIQIVRRHRLIFGALVLAGLVLGCGYTLVSPPPLTSQALVVIPVTSATSAPTEVVIAGSDPVLSGALTKVGGMSLAQLRSRIGVSSLTASIIEISARDTSASTAETMANAVATSYVNYVGAVATPIGDVHARVLELASTAIGPARSSRLVLTGIAGGLAGAFAGLIISLAIGRNDRRMRQRDEIANSVGLPVLASLPSGRPRDVAGWARLLEGYEPDAVRAWQLRRMLSELAITGRNGDASRASLTVLSVSCDAAAVSVGPQIASFAASLGVPTVLVLSPQQDQPVVATLRTFCTSLPDGAPAGTRPLRVRVTDEAHELGAGLLVSVVVVDGQAPRMPAVPRTDITLLGVGCGAVTAEQLARAATIASADGRPVSGIVVADPDSADETTGRMPRLGSAGTRTLPTRMTGLPTETRW